MPALARYLNNKVLIGFAQTELKVQEQEKTGTCHLESKMAIKKSTLTHGVYNGAHKCHTRLRLQKHFVFCTCAMVCENLKQGKKVREAIKKLIIGRDLVTPRWIFELLM